MLSPITMLFALILSVKGVNVSLSNVKLPVDTLGNLLLTGEADVLQHNGSYYVYFNNWGGCAGIDCCNSSSGCASCCFTSPPYTDPCVYTTNHSVVVYQTDDWQRFVYRGVALSVNDRPEPRIEFRPHVLYNAASNQFVMWFESRTKTSMYAIATSDNAIGPFHTIVENVVLPGSGRVGDYDVFVDDDGIAYHVRTGFDVVQLDATYTKPTTNFVSFKTPLPSEAPIMFKRDGVYYIIAGTSCCSCKGGSTVYLFSSTTPLGNYSYLGDFGRNNTQPFNEHSPYNFVTRSQPTAVFTTQNCDGTKDYVFMGNQWVTAHQPGRPRNHDLLFFQKLQFNSNGIIQALEWRDTESLCIS